MGLVLGIQLLLESGGFVLLGLRRRFAGASTGSAGAGVSSGFSSIFFFFLLSAMTFVLLCVVSPLPSCLRSGLENILDRFSAK